MVLDGRMGWRGIPASSDNGGDDEKDEEDTKAHSHNDEGDACWAVTGARVSVAHSITCLPVISIVRINYGVTSGRVATGVKNVKR